MNIIVRMAGFAGANKDLLKLLFKVTYRLIIVLIVLYYILKFIPGWSNIFVLFEHWMHK